MPDAPKRDRSKTAVMGAGNILMGDEGVGVHVVQALKNEKGLPDGIEIIDAGTAALDVLHALEDFDRLVIIDAVRGGGAPGTIYQFSPDDVSQTPARRISLHQMSLLEALNVGRMLGARSPEVVIVGVEPKTVAPGTNLSIALANRLSEIVKIVVALVMQQKRDPQRRYD